MAFKKYIHLLISVTFMWFVFVQHNDSDSLLWSAIYSFVSLTAFMAFIEESNKNITSLNKRKKSKYLAWVFILPLFIYLVYNIDLLTSWLQAGRPAFIAYEKTDIQVVENIREFLGLIISLASLLYYSLRQ